MEQLVPLRGDYKKLLSYQKTDVIYQLTYFFCQKFMKSSDRTVDQMLQAARSGKQNIIEGTAASSTSTKSEIFLLNVAKASLKELIEDYEDYIKTRGGVIWEFSGKENTAMRQLGISHNDAGFFLKLAETRSAITIANMAIVLIKQADYLLFKQIKRIENDFLEDGGFSERMYRLRKQKRDTPKDPKDPKDKK